MKKSAFSVFETTFRADEIRDDREAITRFLQQYLRDQDLSGVPALNHGPKIRLDGNREPIGQSSWKWTEVRGKYIGCPYWSVEAVAAFSRLVPHYPEDSLPAVAKKASKRDRGDGQLQHEHVFPRKAWIRLMSESLGSSKPPGVNEVRDLLDRYCVGCIVTAKEHKVLGSRGISENPWMRYEDSGIRIVRNPHWASPHREWIEEVGLGAAA
jgi:hypothetical protein